MGTRCGGTSVRLGPTATAASASVGAKVKASFPSRVRATATATATAAPTTAPTAAPTVAATDSAQATIKLDVVQWAKTNAGDPIAVVRDTDGTLWYVWGPDVTRIEQGLKPQYDPVPVNRVTRTRHS